MTRSCSQCCFCDTCVGTRVCEYYAPADDKIDNEFIADEAERYKDEFRKAWVTYINEDE